MIGGALPGSNEAWVGSGVIVWLRVAAARADVDVGGSIPGVLEAATASVPACVFWIAGATMVVAEADGVSVGKGVRVSVGWTTGGVCVGGTLTAVAVDCADAQPARI